jgi:hypothetical protein
MKMHIDLKSALLGLVFGLLAALSLGASGGHGIAQIGRFQLAGTHAHALLVDTAPAGSSAAILLLTQGQQMQTSSNRS